MEFWLVVTTWFWVWTFSVYPNADACDKAKQTVEETWYMTGTCLPVPPHEH